MGSFFAFVDTAPRGFERGAGRLVLGWSLCMSDLVKNFIDCESKKLVIISALLTSCLI